ncbi:hypothetical protein BDW22DRAFT_1358224 [Trametopsis cervina]|nr:hypothetical protein BDW22DRAFT_1358224 [Trametopsis cervina]
MAYYGGVMTIVPSNIILRYPTGQVPQTNVPTELQPYYKEDVWASRITAACRTANRYHKKAFEWVWLLISSAALIGAPIAIYYVALNNLPDDDDKKDDKDKDDDHHIFHRFDFDKYWKARLISFAVWVALMFLVFVPMHIWKRKGKTAVNELLASWEKEDMAVRPPGMPFPSLRMKMPGVISKNIKFVLTFPPSAPTGPSMYQAGSNVPPYLANPPSDPAAQAYYQQPPAPYQQYQQYQQPPHTSQMGQASGFLGQGPGVATPYNPRENAPGCYQNAPAYGADGPRADNPFADEKAAANQFENVKV